MWCRRITKSILSKALITAPKIPKPGSLVTNTGWKDPAHSTVDSVNVELFSKHTKDWWDPNGPFKMLHQMNLIRVPLVRDGLVQYSADERASLPLKDKKILDVGCGGGILSEGLARLGALVTGIDATKELIEVAQQHSNIDPKIARNKPTYFNTTIEDHVKNYSNQYDGVVASEVIEHVNNQELFVKSCIQATKPGGKIFFTTPNRTRLSQFIVIFVCENILNAIPKGTHQYEKFITPNELQFILERNGCHMELTFGYAYNILTEKWSFTSFDQVGYVMQALKLK